MKPDEADGQNYGNPGGGQETGRSGCQAPDSAHAGMTLEL
jgi:hypothetical protein